MKKNLFKYLAMFGIIAIALLACQKENEPLSESSNATQVVQKAQYVNTDRIREALREFQGRRVRTNFIGRVIGRGDQPIAGATVTLGGQQQVTDDNGIVTFIGAVVYENFAYATATASGYTDGSRVMVPNYGDNNENTFTIKLFSLENAQTISSSGGEVSVRTELGREVIIAFDGGFVDENGNPYSGNVAVTVNHLDPLSEETANTMPGELYGLDRNYQEVALGSYGMVHVELRGSMGQKLQISNPATILMPIHPNQMASAPSQVPFWSFIKETGTWFEETVAYKDGAYYKAVVNHFSFWNCDAPFPVANFNATVVDAGTLVPVSGLTVTINYNSFSRYAITDNNGNVSGKIPTNQTMTLTITDHCGTVLYNDPNFGPFTGATSITIPVSLVSVSSINVSGTVLDCNGLPVTNGYVTYSSGGGQFFGTTLVTAGTHSYSAVSCSIPATINVEGADVGTGQVIASTTVIANPNATANLTACGGLAPEYIRYSINGNPVVYEIQSPWANIEQGMYLSMGTTSPIGGGTMLIGNATTLGTYPFDSNPFATGTPSMAIKRLGTSTGIDPVSSTGITGSIVFNITSIGGVGAYIDVSFSGTYIDQFGGTNTITGDAHILRDN
ncbi:hypothetical protein [uncultured Kordia sp.]|uniref:hypothetical protein n=1 Tax=uncultured Kordia sp. TaxID=507699 RepID=UPI00260637E7|nr:hypothetical protein [uncultured Kordia sp.]